MVDRTSPRSTQQQSMQPFVEYNRYGPTEEQHPAGAGDAPSVG